MKKRVCHHGFMAIDMIFGLIIISIVAILLAAGMARVRSADAGLAQSRRATHLAEHALLNLQHHQPMPTASDDSHLAIHSVNTGTAPAGYAWAKVDASVHGHHESLIGVVPVGALQNAEAK